MRLTKAGKVRLWFYSGWIEKSPFVHPILAATPVKSGEVVYCLRSVSLSPCHSK